MQGAGNAGDSSRAAQRALPHRDVQGFPQIQLFSLSLQSGGFPGDCSLGLVLYQPFLPLSFPGGWGLDTQAMPALTAVPCPAPAGGERAAGGEPVPAGTAAEEDGVQEPGGAGPAVSPPAAGRHAAPGALLQPGERDWVQEPGHRLILLLPSCCSTRERRCDTWVVVRPAWEELAGLGTLGTITLPSSP